jgi:hypothetical protein
MVAARSYEPLFSCDEHSSSSSNSWQQTFLFTVLNELVSMNIREVARTRCADPLER